MNGVTIDTVIAPAGMWHVRRHVIRTDVTLEAAEGAFSVPRDWAGARPCDRISTTTNAGEGYAAAAGERGTSVIYGLEGYAKGEVIVTEPNTNLMENTGKPRKRQQRPGLFLTRARAGNGSPVPMTGTAGGPEDSGRA